MTARRARAVAVLGALALAAGCKSPGSRSVAAPGAAAASPALRDVAVPHAPEAPQVSAEPVVPLPEGPSGTVVATVFLDGPLRAEAPLTVPAALRNRPACRDAARRYSQPFDVTAPGPMPGALVAVEAHSVSAGPSRERRITFRDCDIIPRVVFAAAHDHIMLHSDTRESHLPTIQGSGAVINQLLIPGQGDVERHLPGPGLYPVAAQTLPPFAITQLIVMANRFIDTTDVQGRATVTQVPVGRHVVHAWYPGTVDVREVVEVRAGETHQVTFHLRQTPPRPAPRAVDAGGEIPP